MAFLTRDGYGIAYSARGMLPQELRMVAKNPSHKDAVKKPKNLDVKGADELVQRVIEKNVEWLKEMAKR